MPLPPSILAAIIYRGCSEKFNELQKVVTSVAGDILGMMRKDEREERRLGGHSATTLMRPRAPKGVILYFEGLDCSGKSSTGGLVQAALEKAGYEVGMRQYNRPPTAEQRQVTTTIVPMRFHRRSEVRLPPFR
jgi:hypothetical protein